MYGQTFKIEVYTVKEYSKQEAEYRIIDNANILQSILSKQFAAERIGGFVNLIAATRPTATEDEIQKALVNRGLKCFPSQKSLALFLIRCLFRIICMAL